MLKTFFGFVAILAMTFSSSVSAMGSPDDAVENAGVPFDGNIMVFCNEDQGYSLIKGTESSHYCSYNGRYLTKAHWDGDSTKVLTTGSNYSTVRDAMFVQNYRLPTLKELLEFINFDVFHSNGKSTDPFIELTVAGNWFQNASYSPSNDITNYVDGYLISSTYKQDSTFMAVNIRSREIVALDILGTFTDSLYVLGVRDYFQILESSSNLCLGFDLDIYNGTAGAYETPGYEFHTSAPGNENEATRTRGQMVRAVSCAVDDPSQRWYINNNKLYLQNRNENEYCLKADSASLSSTPGDCTSFDSMSDRGLTHLSDSSGQYLIKNVNDSQLNFEVQGAEPDRSWFIQY